MAAALTCRTCRKPVEPGRYWFCDEQELSDQPWCDDCFDVTPCGKGEHGEGCSTLVISDGEP